LVVSRTTIYCVFLFGSVIAASDVPGDEKMAPPKLPVAVVWTVDLGAAASVPPAIDGERIYVALRTGQLVAHRVADGRELWRANKTVTSPLAVGGGLVFVAGAEAIEALHAADGKTAWIVPRMKIAAPLVAEGGWLVAVTDAEVIAIRASDGEVVWRHSAGGVILPPAIDGPRLYTGAGDGRVMAIELSSGEVAWEHYVPGGVTALAAHDGLVYVGAGDKDFYCLSARNGKESWPKRIGSIVTGRIAADDQRVYLSARDNMVYALDHANGNQRWVQPLRRRPIAGVVVLGHVVFVPTAAAELTMLYDKDGRPSGSVALPGQMLPGLSPDLMEMKEGLQIAVVTGGLSNQWQLTLIASAGELPMAPFAAMDPFPGVPYLTDPILEPIEKALGSLIADDPVLLPASSIEWPFLLTDPPLEPLTALPGLQLRPLSPTLPARRERPGQAG
jgi:outer membrane protein assembly factor BamB